MTRGTAAFLSLLKGRPVSRGGRETQHPSDPHGPPAAGLAARPSPAPPMPLTPPAEPGNRRRPPPFSSTGWRTFSGRRSLRFFCDHFDVFGGQGLGWIGSGQGQG